MLNSNVSFAVNGALNEKGMRAWVSPISYNNRNNSVGLIANNTYSSGEIVKTTRIRLHPNCYTYMGWRKPIAADAYPTQGANYNVSISPYINNVLVGTNYEAGLPFATVTFKPTLDAYSSAIIVEISNCNCNFSNNIFTGGGVLVVSYSNPFEKKIIGAKQLQATYQQAGRANMDSCNKIFPNKCSTINSYGPSSYHTISWFICMTSNTSQGTISGGFTNLPTINVTITESAL